MTWLFGQIWLWTAIAFVLGLLLGRLIWGRRTTKSEHRETTEVVTPEKTPEKTPVETPVAAPAAPAAVEQKENAIGSMTVRERTAPAATSGSALSNLDEGERTTVLRHDQPDDKHDDNPAADETPTGQIPVQTLAGGAADQAGGQPATAAPIEAPDTAERAPRGRGRSGATALVEAPAPVAVPAPAPAPSEVDGPYGKGSASPRADGSTPSSAYMVKGNADSMLFHTTDSPYYTRTKAEAWFVSAEAAQRAGFTAWNERTATQTEEPTWAPGRFPKSAAARPDGSAPAERFTVKGNADSMLFHTRTSPYYTRTKAEVWFASTEDAEQAGFTAWNRRRTQQANAVKPGPYLGSALPLPGGAAPAREYVIKGNEDSKLYHTQDSPFFNVTTAEVWFTSTADAERAGFMAWRRIG